jgi:serine/threonine-protein kinase
VQPDSVLSGKYRLIRQLDRGGMGAVWEAQHLVLGSSVAVKLMDAEISASPETMTRFLREAQAAAALRSPHVVQILDYGIDEGVPYIVMELLEGETLATRLARQVLSPSQTAQLLTDVARALARAHEVGIVHRDLKPENVFIIRNDDQELAKVLDFGIAKTPRGLVASLAVEPDSSTDTGALLGTPNYMSPEQAYGSKELDYRTDIWSLGVIACECLTGTRPFEAPTVGKLLVAICTEPIPIPSALGPVPAGFDAWFARACARDVTERFQSAREAMAELRRVCEWAPSSPVPSPPSSNGPRAESRAGATQHPYTLTPSFARRRVRWTTLPLALVLVALLGSVIFVVLRRNALVDASPPADATPPHSAAATAPLPSTLPNPSVSLTVSAPSAAVAPPAVPAASGAPASRPASRPRPPSPAPPPKPSDAEDLGI